MHVDDIDHLVDQRWACGFGRAFPERIHVHVGNVGSDLVEPFGNVD